ncbi:MAG: hypothetical protein AABX53_01170 [Nanoarchaeota archaeon]
MDLKRALWTSALSWVLVFFEVSVLMFGFGVQNTDSNIAHYILFAIAILIPAYLYFKRAKASALEGIYLTLVYLVVSLILDAVITIPLFIKEYAFLLNPYHLIGLAISFVVTIVLGALMKK